MRLVAYCLLLITITGVVFAAGTSTGRSADEPSDDPYYPSEQDDEVDCENLSTIERRITCRLENQIEVYSYSVVPEACRGILDQSACELLYDDSSICYDSSSAEMDGCFFEKTGISQEQPLDEQSKEAVRQYTILLLYELQKRAESIYDEDEIPAATIAEVVADIVRIKHMLFNEEPIADVKLAVADLKQDWEMKLQ